MCPNAEFFLVHNFRVQENADQKKLRISYFRCTGKYGLEKTPYFDTFHAVKVEVRIIRIDYYLADLVTVFYLFICFIISRIKESFCKGNVFWKITQACKLPRESKLKNCLTFFLNVAKVFPTFSIIHCFMKSSNSSLGESKNIMQQNQSIQN